MKRTLIERPFHITVKALLFKDFFRYAHLPVGKR